MDNIENIKEIPESNNSQMIVRETNTSMNKSQDSINHNS
jgi:hypothetical protein